MPKFKVYFECVEDPYVIIEAKNSDEASELAEGLYDDFDIDIFLKSNMPEISAKYSGFFSPAETEEITQ